MSSLTRQDLEQKREEIVQKIFGEEYKIKTYNIFGNKIDLKIPERTKTCEEDLIIDEFTMNDSIEKIKEIIKGELQLPRARVGKDKYYLNIAAEVAQRGTCLRRNYGAVIVKNDEIISTGYTGVPRGLKHCTTCERERQNVKPGERYELCRSVHAEMNAVISAARKDMIGGTLFLAGIDAKTGKIIKAEPCALCMRVLINAGIQTIIGTDTIAGEYYSREIEVTNERY